MIESLVRGLRQPEYVHVLLNPLPVYGLLIAWIGLDRDRGEDLIWIFYALAALSAVAIAAPIKWPKSSAPLVIAVIFLGAGTLGTGGFIAYAGGKIRHREFRNEPPPPKRTHEDEH